jgi:hypothetical protein
VRFGLSSTRVFRSRSVRPPRRGGTPERSPSPAPHPGDVGCVSVSTVHTFVHRLCIHGPGRCCGPSEAGDDAIPSLSDQVRGGFGESRPEAAGSTKPRCGVHRGELGSADANKPDTCGSSGCPQVGDGSWTSFSRASGFRPTATARKVARFDPSPDEPVPLGGRTGVDRCRMSTPHPRGWAVPVEADRNPGSPDSDHSRHTEIIS